MVTYRYKGMSSSGAEVEGIVEAFDEQDALARARENCRVLISVEPVNNSKLNAIMNADRIAIFGLGNSAAERTDYSVFVHRLHCARCQRISETEKRHRSAGAREIREEAREGACRLREEEGLRAD